MVSQKVLEIILKGCERHKEKREQAEKEQVKVAA